jgi:hypothetical protein
LKEKWCALQLGMKLPIDKNSGVEIFLGFVAEVLVLG